ncbi:hypothetical protein GCM10027343_16710 [Noviherbaspirillum agri]
MGGRRRREYQGFKSGIGELRLELAGSLAIEANTAQSRTLVLEHGEVVGLRMADRGVEAAFTGAGSQYVP